MYQVKEDGAIAMSEHYPSDLTDQQWQLIRPLLPKRAKHGRPPIDRREILDAVLYVVRTGCQWRQLPLNFPKRLPKNRVNEKSPFRIRGSRNTVYLIGG